MQATSPGIDTLGRIFLARGNVMTCWSEDFDWRGDSRRAGGGVLLDRAYGLVDAVVAAMGVPGTVYAAMAGSSRPAGKFPYDTEDTAGVICQYADGGMAVFSACWTAGPDRWYLVLNGIDGSIRFEETRVQAYDRAGVPTIDEQQRSDDPFLPPIEDFLSQLHSNPRKIQGHLRTHLPTVATLEAAYLSARTGEQESPERILEVHEEPKRSRR
jgi:predicted dehydrogenase